MTNIFLQQSQVSASLLVEITLCLILIAILIWIMFRMFRIVPQAQALVIERLGKFHKSVTGSFTIIIPFIDRIRNELDLREQVVDFPPQPVITKDNLTVNLDFVVYFKVNDILAATYGISNVIVAVEQITITTLRNVVGGLTFEEALTSRDTINTALRGALDEATETWGIRVARVELRSIDVPPDLQQAMERQMKADREKRATITTAEGKKQAAITQAQAHKQSTILSAHAQASELVLRAEADAATALLNAEADNQQRILNSDAQKAFEYKKADGIAEYYRILLNTTNNSELFTAEFLQYYYAEQLPQLLDGVSDKKIFLPGGDLDSLVKIFTHDIAKLPLNVASPTIDAPHTSNTQNENINLGLESDYEAFDHHAVIEKATDDVDVSAAEPIIPHNLLPIQSQERRKRKNTEKKPDNM